MESLPDLDSKHNILRFYDLTVDDIASLNAKAIEESELSSNSMISDIKVGCALMTNDNTIYSGHLIEDLAYGESISAEDSAIQKALSADCNTKFKAISVHYRYKEGLSLFTMPNGKWRQNMQKYGHFVMVSCQSKENYVLKSSASLEPYSY